MGIYFLEACMTESTATPFLILHKVRGASAFDIAERCEIDGEEAWVVSTSGHRAYPFAYWSLADEVMAGPLYASDQEKRIDPATLAAWPDHYQVKSSPAPLSIPGLLAKLGLGSKPIKRRKL
jgi:hypothetical protein